MIQTKLNVHSRVDVMQDTTVESVDQMNHNEVSSLASLSTKQAPCPSSPLATTILPPPPEPIVTINAKLDMVQQNDTIYETELSERNDEGWSSMLDSNLQSLDIGDTIKEILDEVESMDGQIKQSQVVLDKSVQLEMFIHSRYQRYRKVIQDQRNIIQYDHQQQHFNKSSCVLIDDSCLNAGLLETDKKSDVELGNETNNTSSNNEMDVPDETKYIQRLQKLENDEKMLESVRQQHLCLLTNCEQMKRNLHDLHERKAVLIRQTNKYL